MNDSENNKSMEALPDDALDKVSGGAGLLDRHADHKTLEELADEALDAVAGGSDRFAALLGGQACADCPRIDESVHMHNVIFDGCSMSINLCPDCVAKRRQRGQVVQ